jgi:endonuclease G
LDKDEILRIKAAAEEELFRIPGVIGVGLGPKLSGATPTGELAIIVLVTHKRPLADVPVAERIPPEFQGLKTDVAESAPTVLEDELLGEPPYADQRKFRQGEGGLRGGIQLARQVSFGATGQGTLGCIAKTNPPDVQVVALTNAHVVNETPNKQEAEKLGNEIGQPSPGECGDCCSDLVGKVTGAAWDDLVDCAFITLNPGLAWVAEIEGIGPIKGTVALPDLDDTQLKTANVIVRKRGRTTLFTRGLIRSVHMTFKYVDNGVQRDRKEQIQVLPSPPFRRFSAGGDSGSVYVNGNSEVVGLHWAGNGTEGRGSPILTVTSKLKVTIQTATAAGQIQIVPPSNHPNTPPQQAPAAAGAPAPLSRAARATFASARERLATTELGRQYGETVEQRLHEMRQLVMGNKRVAAVWRSNDGPAIASRLFSCPFTPSRKIFHGLPSARVDEALNELFAMFERFGSEELRRDLRTLRPKLREWAGMSYADLLRDLDRSPAGRPESGAAPW